MTIFTAKSQPKYSNIRRKRKLRKITRVNVPEIPGSKNIFLGVVAMFLFALVIFSGLKILSADYFQVNSVTTIGVRTVSSQQIFEDIENLTTEGIFLTSGSSIEKTLIAKYPSFKSVTVNKIWPDKLIINITEKQPALFYLNLNGIYLINEDGIISEVIFQDKINFAQEQLNIITGAEGIDSVLVYDRLKSEYLEKQEEIEQEGVGGKGVEEKSLQAGASQEEGSDQEQKTDFDISQIPQDQKFATLNTIREELFDQAKVIIISYLEKFDSTAYPSLEKVFAFDNNVYQEGDMVDQDKLQLTREVLKFFSQNNVVVSEVLWEGKFVVKLITEPGKTLVFGTSRNISEQLEDYLVVTRELEKEEKNYNEIDLSSRKVSVK